jgi:DNA-binding MarR family transcriptional regulator
VRSHDEYAHRILTEIEGGEAISQRSLAGRLGIALGLTNLLVRRLARKGWIRVAGIKPHRVKYLITPQGIAEKARMTREYLKHSLAVYSQARDRIGERFSTLSAEWPGTGSGGEKRVVFYGADEVAEIGFVCLQLTDLKLVGVVSADAATRSRSFFGMPVHSREALRPGMVAGVAFDMLVVMSFDDRDAVQRSLDEIDYRHGGVFWV